MASRLLVPLLALMVVLNTSAAAFARAASEYETGTQALTRLDQRSLAFRSAYHATNALIAGDNPSWQPPSGILELPLAGGIMSFLGGGTALFPSATVVWRDACIEIAFEAVGNRVKIRDVNDHESP